MYEGGRLKRDFTYIDDIVAGIIGCLDRPPIGPVPARVLNIGNHRSEAVSTLIGLLEQALGRQAVIRDARRPAADVEETFAAIEAIADLTGFAPSTPLSVGIPHFAAWFQGPGHGRSRERDDGRPRLGIEPPGQAGAYDSRLGVVRKDGLRLLALLPVVGSDTFSLRSAPEWVNDNPSGPAVLLWAGAVAFILVL